MENFNSAVIHATESDLFKRELYHDVLIAIAWL